MATMNISLPDKMREWIDQQVATGRFSNASDLMRDLIRDAQARGEHEKARGEHAASPLEGVKTRGGNAVAATHSIKA